LRSFRPTSKLSEYWARVQLFSLDQDNPQT
jgi:hypothetical protein